jgi:putative transposase
MARHLRIEYPGALYHVTARGNDRQSIFRTTEDRLHLLELLAEGLERYEVHLFGYVLMTNHYHLVVQTEHPNLNRFMHYLNTAYTVWTNKRNRRTGHLFEGRYKAIAIQEEGYLLSVTGYVHLNPVRVSQWRSRSIEERMEHVAAYPWSSFRAYTKTMPKGAEPTISCDRAWGELGARNPREGRRQYSSYIRGWLVKEAEEQAKPKGRRELEEFAPLSEARLGCFLGGDEFRDFIQGLLGADESLSQEVVGSKAWRHEVPVAKVLELIASTRNVTVENLQERRRPHPERDLAMYLCRQTAEKSLREIGEAFGIGPAAVGHAVKRGKQRTKEDKRLARSVTKSKETLIRLLET